ERDKVGAVIDAQLRLVAADRNHLDVLAHDFEYRLPGESSGTPFAHNGQSASVQVSSDSVNRDAYGTSKGLSTLLRLRIDPKPTTTPPRSSITAAVSRVDLPVVTTS